MVRGGCGGDAGSPATRPAAEADGCLSARDLRDLRAVLRVVSDNGRVAAVRMKHLVVELAPGANVAQGGQQQQAHAEPAERAARKGHGSPRQRSRQRERRHGGVLHATRRVDADGGVGGAAVGAAHVAPAARQLRRRGPAARARSKARLDAFIEGKRRYLDCELHARLRQLVKRLRFERMWHVKNAWAEGRVVAPSLSEVAAYLSSPRVLQQPQGVAGAKRAATSDPASPPAGDGAANVPKGAVAPSLA